MTRMAAGKQSPTNATELVVSKRADEGLANPALFEKVAAQVDWRYLPEGRVIPTVSYADQPYLLKTDDGAWLCVVTTGTGREGEPGQHVTTLRSTDQGRTWSTPVPVEPIDGPESSYAVLFKTPTGRIYVFYNHNTDNVRRVKGDPEVFPDGYCYRVDSLGHFVFKYSDDHGRTWSARRYPIPVREMAIDRENADGGKLRYFWNVGRPFERNGSVYVSHHKVGGFGHGFFTRVEGTLLRSDNLLTETDPAKIAWETLPEGDRGICTPPGGGPIAAEQSYSVMSDGSIYCVFRTTDGHPAETVSRDGGRTFETPRYKCYADGRPMKHPRAANFAWRCRNGKYLYWCHNHGGRDYEDRNPVWLCGGEEIDTPPGRIIQWTQPEILFYDDDPYVRMSYPDMIEEDGRLYITETQKSIARVHEVNPRLLNALWTQFEANDDVVDGLLLDLGADGRPVSGTFAMPELPALTVRDNERHDYGLRDMRAGFSLDLWLTLDTLEPGQVVFDTRTSAGKGVALITAPHGAVEIVLHDGRTENRWRCDPHALTRGRRHHVVAIVDGGPKVITFVIDGLLHDGGAARQFGWGRFSPLLYEVNGNGSGRVGGPGMAVHRCRVYGRYLFTSEAISNFRAAAAGADTILGKSRR